MVGPEGLAGAWWGIGGGGGGAGLLATEDVLVAHGSLQEPVSGVGLVWAADLTAPETAELGYVDCVTGHGYVDHLGAGQDSCGEGGREP